MDRDHFWLNVRQFALLVPHSADGKPRVDDRLVITGIVYVLLHGIHALTDVCCRPIGFLLTGGMRPIAIWVASITAATGREYSPACRARLYRPRL